MNSNGYSQSPFSRFSCFLDTQQEAILDRWHCLVRQDARVVSSKALGRTALLDHLPDMLGDMSRLLRDTGDGSDSRKELEVDSETHGSERWSDGYSLNELILEIDHFRKILLVNVIADFASKNSDIQSDAIDDICTAMFNYSHLIIARSIQQYTDAKDAELRIANDALTAVNRQLDSANKRLLEDCRKFQELSLKDPLTDLSNRRQLDIQLLIEIDRCVRYGDSLCIITMDLDHFKRFNDMYGHAVGDRVLMLVARQLEYCSRASDQVARYGGEEFVLLLPQSDLHTAVVLAERIRTSLMDIKLDRVPEIVTGSIGVTQLRKSESADQLLNRADSALYDAKAAGRNCVITLR